MEIACGDCMWRCACGDVHVKMCTWRCACGDVHVEMCMEYLISSGAEVFMSRPFMWGGLLYAIYV